MWLRRSDVICELYFYVLIIVMSVAKGTWPEKGDELIHKGDDILGEWSRGVQGVITHVY
jgi:hypothetical protein